MESIAPSAATIVVLRAISRAGFAYGATKELAHAAGWTLVDDEPDLGCVRYSMALAHGRAERCLCVQVFERGSRPRAFVPLFYFEEYDDTRVPFDQAHRSLTEQLTEFLGATLRTGTYVYPHRPEWLYSFAGWSLDDATLVLVQDEFDIQFGMDVTLWVQPAGTTITGPVEIA